MRNAAGGGSGGHARMAQHAPGLEESGNGATDRKETLGGRLTGADDGAKSRKAKSRRGAGRLIPSSLGASLAMRQSVRR